MSVLPPEVSPRLARLAVPVRGIGPSGAELAWLREEALEVLESLRGTKVAIVGGDVHRAERWGIVPTADGWTCSILPGETASDYAERSRRMAENRVKRPGDPGEQVLYYALAFSHQQEAA